MLPQGSKRSSSAEWPGWGGCRSETATRLGMENAKMQGTSNTKVSLGDKVGDATVRRALRVGAAVIIRTTRIKRGVLVFVCHAESCHVCMYWRVVV